jgi:flagellin
VAATAAAALDTAITKVTSLRATVGALQSRFNFASNAIQSAIENQDAARASLLDTDVAAESSAFASAQVQQQAGIAVLAQANQLPQSLLKLIQ